MRGRDGGAGEPGEEEPNSRRVELRVQVEAGWTALRLVEPGLIVGRRRVPTRSGSPIVERERVVERPPSGVPGRTGTHGRRKTSHYMLSGFGAGGREECVRRWGGSPISRETGQVPYQDSTFPVTALIRTLTLCPLHWTHFNFNASLWADRFQR